MEYQKIVNLLDNEVALSVSNKPSKFRTRNQVEINDDIRGAYSPNKKNQIENSNAKVNNTAAAGAAANNINKKVIFKNCAPFANCISKINNTRIDNAEYTDI